MFKIPKSNKFQVEDSSCDLLYVVDAAHQVKS